ncbi:sensor histidine kinase [Paraburkholderia humisilvae]|uniref:histidine kinase n=1 Tax=Paraburkholderia humisilvae TaxID=627669 RepID=A0A6J5EVH1_9BURK|nr:HAMP domain-containing sensor histidine kinase [Paraburkholderia humisilvae]CAB3769152.1 Adaptive-response sensory-kinase SasA [Paraburkholderia humisilvae]
MNLSQRLSLVFSALLLASCAVSAWLQIRASDLHDQEVIQSVSRDLASHIAQNGPLIDAHGPRADMLRALFSQLMAVNPSVEVYLLDANGQVKGDDAPPGHVKRNHVDVRPIRRFLTGDTLPILGDDPRSDAGRKVFSAAALPGANGTTAGYVYVVLLGEAHDQWAARIGGNSVLRTTLWSMTFVALCSLIAGLIAFRLITRPLGRLTEAVRDFDAGDEIGARAKLSSLPPSHARDEIAILERAFVQMSNRIAQQWRELTYRDQERRELIANISHDLRTPLTSLHGYLEALSLKFDMLREPERRRYLSIALGQSAKVGRLAQSLFELARLEHGQTQLSPEAFSLADLLQDVFEKFELAAQARRISLRADIPPRLPDVHADLGMIERVLTNLLDNAIRHTPEGGMIEVELAFRSNKVTVTFSDTGPGIPPELRDSLFLRPVNVGGAQRVGGLGLLIVQQILHLHGSAISLADRAGRGGTFVFTLNTAMASPDR